MQGLWPMKDLFCIMLIETLRRHLPCERKKTKQGAAEEKNKCWTFNSLLAFHGKR